jgi:sec-independent protein translocase protein TatA
MTTLGIVGLGPIELAVIIGAILLIFGPSRLPQLARSIGQSIRLFKEGQKEVDREPDPAPREIEQGTPRK